MPDEAYLSNPWEQDDQQSLILSTEALDTPAVEGDSEELRGPSKTKRIEISFKDDGEGTLKCVDLGEFSCLGQPGRGYPKDLTVSEKHKEDLHKSIEFGVDMPYAILIWGQKGIYIHEFPCSLKENKGPSAGCIHLCPGAAKKVYDWITGKTRIIIKYPWKTTIK
jgi:hypothetical protein